MIVLGILVDLGGGPNHDHMGFRYWRDPGPFANHYGFTSTLDHFLGTCSVVSQAMFAYLCTESVTVRFLSTTPSCPA